MTTKADPILTAIGEEIFNRLAAVHNGGCETQAFPSVDHDIVAGEDGTREITVQCGDEIAASMDIVPESVRRIINARWKSDWADMYGVFVEDWNDGHGTSLPRPKKDASFPDAMTAYNDALDELSGLGDSSLASDFRESLAEAISERFGDGRCIFRISSFPDSDGIGISVAINANLDPGGHLWDFHPDGDIALDVFVVEPENVQSLVDALARGDVRSLAKTDGSPMFPPSERHAVLDTFSGSGLKPSA